jgi:hypothetical protein
MLIKYNFDIILKGFLFLLRAEQRRGQPSSQSEDKVDTRRTCCCWLRSRGECCPSSSSSRAHPQQVWHRRHAGAVSGHLVLMLYTASSLLLIWKWKYSSSEIARMDPEAGSRRTSSSTSRSAVRGVELAVDPCGAGSSGAHVVEVYRASGSRSLCRSPPPS